MLRYIFVFSIISIFIYSCGDIFNSTVEFYPVLIDTLIVKDSVSESDTLDIGLLGTLGPNSCYRFSHYQVTTTENGISIKVIGKHILDEPCLDAFSSLNEIYKIYSLSRGFYYVKIINPENNYLMDSVFVY